MIKPKTRKEVFMDAIAKGKKPPIEPLTREEVLMAEHAEREASGGGGSAAIVITKTADGEFTANMTVSEAFVAASSGANIVLIDRTYSPNLIYGFKWAVLDERDGELGLNMRFTDAEGNEVKVNWNANGTLFQPGGLS